MYPVKQVDSHKTRVLTSINLKEQRWTVRPVLQKFEFKYKRVNADDLETLRQFFETQKGSFGTFDLEFDEKTYTWMAFDQDVFAPTENPQWPNLWDLELKMAQTKPDTILDDVDLEEELWFPELNESGIYTQLPFSPGQRFFISKSETDDGSRQAFYWYEWPLAVWEMNFPTITTEEIAVLRNFFDKCRGKWRTFKAKHPDNEDVTIENLRFDMDELEIEYQGPNHFSTKLRLVETRA